MMRPRTQAFARVAAVVTVLVALLVLAGWAVDVSLLRRISPAGVIMRPNAAVALFLAGISLWLASLRLPLASRAARAGGSMVTLIGLLSLSQDVMGWDLGMDRILFPGALRNLGPGFSPRIPAEGALGMALLGLALLLRGAASRSLRRAGEACALVTFGIAFFVTVGYAYRVADLSGLGPHARMPAYAAVLFLLLGAAVIERQSDGVVAGVLSSPGSGAVIARWLLPIIAAVMLGIGWLRLEGERAGFYPSDVGVALLVVTCLGLLTAALLLGAHRLNRLDLAREQVEAALRDSEERFRGFFDASPVGKSMTAPDGALVRVNPAFCQLLGYSVEELQRLSWIDITHPEDVPESRECVRALLAGERDTWEMDKRYRTKDGRWLWTHVSTGLRRDADGDPLHFLTHVQDISQRKQAEEALRESEERQRLATEGADIGMWFWHVPTDDLVWTPRCKQLFDIAPDQNMSYAVFEQALHPDDRQRTRQVVEQSWRDKSDYRIEYRTRWRDGTVHWLAALGRTHYDHRGQVDRMMGIVLDIDARKRAEDALSEAEQRFRVTFEQAAVGIAHVGLDGTWLRVNQRVCDIVGYTRDELHRLTFQDITYPADLDADLAQAGRLLTGEVDSYSMEKRYIRKDRSPVWINLTASIARDAAGAPKYFISVIEDISARKRIEESLAERTAELARSNGDLERFAYVASHDLQEPLRAVASYAQLLCKRYQGRLDQDADDFVTFIVDGAQRMQAMINDLLALSRVNTSARSPTATDASAAFQRALANLAAAVDASGAEVTSETLPVVRADPTQLAQLFQNLVGNAIKFHGAEPPRVRVWAESRDGEWVFAVRDNGIGIDPQYFGRIFIVFQRLHPRTEYGGTGIGLAICKKIVERHGGRIWVESVPGHGSTFYFTLLGGEERGAS